MDLRSCCPVICTDDVARAHRFWVEWFGFATTFEADRYVGLRAPEGHELALLDHAHPTVPAAYRRPVQGLLINLEAVGSR